VNRCYNTPAVRQAAGIDLPLQPDMRTKGSLACAAGLRAAKRQPNIAQGRGAHPGTMAWRHFRNPERVAEFPVRRPFQGRWWSRRLATQGALRDPGLRSATPTASKLDLATAARMGLPLEAWLVSEGLRSRCRLQCRGSLSPAGCLRTHCPVTCQAARFAAWCSKWHRRSVTFCYRSLGSQFSAQQALALRD